MDGMNDYIKKEAKKYVSLQLYDENALCVLVVTARLSAQIQRQNMTAWEQVEEDVMGFLYAVQWSEPWIIGIMCRPALSFAADPRFSALHLAESTVGARQDGPHRVIFGDFLCTQQQHRPVLLADGHLSVKPIPT